jgi:hypothetical protein
MMAPGGENEMSEAREILDKMAEVYAQCQTYQDSGLVQGTLVRVTTGEIRTCSMPFTTVFARPDRFRFEYDLRRAWDESDVEIERERHVVWKGGDHIWTWIEGRPGIKKRHSLGYAMAGGSGPFGGAAGSIPALLFPNEAGPLYLTEMTEETRIDDGEQDGAACYRIRGQTIRPWSPTVWIDQETFLVRRIDTQGELRDTLREEATTTYEPVLNAEVSEERLALRLQHS